MRFLRLALLIPTFTISFAAHGEGYVGITQTSEYEATEYEIPTPPKTYGPQNLVNNNNQAAGQTAKTNQAPSNTGNDQKDKAYNGKIDKVDNWTKQAYGLLNDGSQEKYTEGLTKVYEEQVREIKAGGLGYRPEYQKYKEKKMPKVEN